MDSYQRNQPGLQAYNTDQHSSDFIHRKDNQPRPESDDAAADRNLVLGEVALVELDDVTKFLERHEHFDGNPFPANMLFIAFRIGELMRRTQIPFPHESHFAEVLKLSDRFGRYVEYLEIDVYDCFTATTGSFWQMFSRLLADMPKLKYLRFTGGASGSEWNA